MMYIKIIDNKIVNIYCGNKPDGTINVPDSFIGVVGQNIAEFDENWNILPLSKRFADGYVQAPKGYKIVGEDFIEMTQIEKYQAGIESIPERMKIKNNMLVPMTNEELVAAGMMTQEELDKITKEIEINELTQYLEDSRYHIDIAYENGTTVWPEIAEKRKAARKRISQLKG